MDDLPIISTHALDNLIQKKTPRIIDCRFNLSDPDWGYENYLLGHIPGAIYAHLNRDLSGPAGPKTGRHPLPDTAAFIQKLAVWGIIARDTRSSFTIRSAELLPAGYGLC